ncbi:hypothetical protein [Fredinandcohnia onubensis]|uniref:hypothetical protein n=1 Tax=Fredinandcohnia onubensis TaxID=1571209 RepID=UPI000C0BEBAB|nr:hypothetical protein [Fredinandcohnia onubensis]
MLTVSQKIRVFRGFHDLKEKVGKDDIRYNYSLPESKKRQKNVICEFNIKTGNGYVSGRYLEPGHPYTLDPRGWINIRDFDELELNKVIRESIYSLSK